MDRDWPNAANSLISTSPCHAETFSPSPTKGQYYQKNWKSWLNSAKRAHSLTETSFVTNYLLFHLSLPFKQQWAAPGAENQGPPGSPQQPKHGPPSAAFAHLVRFVEEQTEIGEDDPQFLPAIAVLELPQQVSRELVLAQNKKKTTMKPQAAALQKKTAATADKKLEAACHNQSCTCFSVVTGLPGISHGDWLCMFSLPIHNYLLMNQLVISLH